jgi:prevent-host-death family protein
LFPSGSIPYGSPWRPIDLLDRGSLASQGWDPGVTFAGDALDSRRRPKHMGDKVSDSPVRIIGSRELHQNLPGILRELENDAVRYVLTVHGKPRAVLVGAEPYLNMVMDGKGPSEALVGLQLSALLGGNLNDMPLDDLEKALDGKGR